MRRGSRGPLSPRSPKHAEEKLRATLEIYSPGADYQAIIERSSLKAAALYQATLSTSGKNLTKNREKLRAYQRAESLTNAGSHLRDQSFSLTEEEEKSSFNQQFEEKRINLANARANRFKLVREIDSLTRWAASERNKESGR